MRHACIGDLVRHQWIDVNRLFMIVGISDDSHRRLMKLIDVETCSVVEMWEFVLEIA
jgi:hypothetical protein